MPNLIRFHFWPPLSSTPDEHLRAKVKALAGELYSRKAIERKLKKAKKYSEGFDRSKGWKIWMWLINTHRTARRQVSILNKCTSRIAQTRLINMRTRDVRDSLGHFEDSLGKVRSRKELERRISRARKSWSRVEQAVEEVRLPISFTNVLLLLRTRSGIETTSLLIGGLIAVGAVYMSYFIEAAVGISAYKYWTVEDLIVQGILMAPYIVGGLLIFELFFIFLRFFFTRRWRYVVYGWISKFHLSSVALFLVFMMLLVSILGYSRGNVAFDKFTRMNARSAQMATAIDNTVLNNVHLVATSDRTAIFLCSTIESKKGNTSSGEGAEDEDKKYKKWRNEMKLTPRPRVGYWRTTNDVLFPFSDKKKKTSSSGSTLKPPPYWMVVMDRALIVCHAQQSKCELPAPYQETEYEGWSAPGLVDTSGL